MSANNFIWIFVIQGIVRSVSNTLPLLKLVCFILSLGGIFALAQLTSGDLLSVSISDLVRILGSTKGWVSYFPFSGVSFDTSVYGFVTSLSSLATYAICRDMFSPVTFRPLVTIRAVITMFCFILRLKLTSASSGVASFSSFVHSRSDGKLALSFTINSDSRFRAPSGLLGFRFRNTLMIDTLDSFLFLHFGLAGALLLSEHKQPLISCVISSLRLDISSPLENRSWFLQNGLVF